MTFVFLHGGPGFNSFAEQAMIGSLFQSAGHEIVFWQEPSKIRPDGDVFDEANAFECWLASAERFVLSAATSAPVHLIAHSMSIHAAVEIVRRHPGCVTTLVMVAPAADAFVTFKNVLRLAQEDLIDTQPDIASAIAESLRRTRAVLDEPMREGLLNVLHDDRIFTHYWANRSQMDASMAARARPEAQFDPDSFFAVLAQFGQRCGTLLSAGTVTVPTLVLFGAYDRITSIDEQRGSIGAAIRHARIEVVDGCSHYVHLDRPQHFLDMVVEWAESTATMTG
jgi:pimeloyl-ACP methyl ester carboxylesterase